MNLARNLRLSFDPATGLVRIALNRRRHNGAGRGKNSTLPARYEVPIERIPRADLRSLCDALHDFADGLDRKDQDA